MAVVEHFRPDAEFYTAERCHITELHNTPADAGCSIARARVVPGVSTQLHGVSDTAERYVIIEGTGEVEIGGEPPVGVQPMDVVTIPAGVSQRISNTGAGDLVFLCICTPRFLRESYLDLEAGAERS